MNQNQDHANARIPPPVLALIHILAAYVLDLLIPFPAAIPGFVRWIGIAIVLIGLGLAFAAVRQFRAAGTTVGHGSPVRALVRKGPYRFSRNPIYLGFACLIAGIPLATGTYWGIPLAFVFMLLASYLVIRHEEAYLEHRFGDIYDSYKDDVRRWL